MSETIITKTCSNCNHVKPISDFYRLKDKHRNICKSCCSIYKKLYRKTNRGKENHRKEVRRYNQTKKGNYVHGRACKKYRNQHPNRIKARKEIEKLVRTEQLLKASSLQCSCGNPAKEYHHHKGYKKEHWLDVIPVCYNCHSQIN